MKKIKISFNKNNIQKLIFVALRYRYLLFFMFFSVFLVFTFGFMYKYAYVNMNFLEYEESYESKVILDIKTNDRILKEILKNIEQRNERLQDKKMDYNNPFEFIGSDISETGEENSSDNENIDNEDKIGDNKENDLIFSPPATIP